MVTFLVLARCGTDDIPIMITDSREEAEKIARGITLQKVQEVANNLMLMEVSDLLTVAVLEFVDGYPISLYTVQ